MSIALNAQPLDGGLGIPFFRNFSSKEYEGHNRNFGIENDDQGRVFVANFEGLLIYDGYCWKMHHTPGISRVTSVFRDSQGTIWFGGNNVVGYLTFDDNGVSTNYLTDDIDENIKLGEVSTFFEQGGKLFFTTNLDQTFQIQENKIEQSAVAFDGNRHYAKYGDIEVNETIMLPELNMTVYATKNRGLVVTNLDGRELYSLTTDNGLCSNTIIDITYDGKGTLWGTTDNGIFSACLSTVYTRFSEQEGLVGQVNTILYCYGYLLVGTLQGLYIQEGQRFEHVEGMDMACWQIVKSSRETVLIASADGFYEYDNSLRQISSYHSLCVFEENDGNYLVGEIDGLYRFNSRDGSRTLAAKIANVTKLVSDGNGGVWALTLYGESYHKTAQSTIFEQEKNENLDLMLRYIDNRGRTWSAANNGKGLVCNPLDNAEVMQRWLRPFDDYTIQALEYNEGIVWAGGNFGLIRLNFRKCKEETPFSHNVYIRYFEQKDRAMICAVSSDKHDPFGQMQYSYRLYKDDEWSRWRESSSVELDNMSYGKYELTFRCIDAFGQITESEAKAFEIPYPVYMRWYFVLLYFLAIIMLTYGMLRYRMHRLELDRQRLERIVEVRTQEVVEKKDQLEATLGELRNAQAELIRKEREATVGKLTKGLIDRILNPMNYINNFSHLTIGLTRDLKEDLEDEEEKMTPDIFEDCMDVVDMMKTNLEKIEQHGISTTRILKAMEEMLNDRSGKTEQLNVANLLKQTVEMTQLYYSKEFVDTGLKINYNHSEEPVFAMVVPELLSKVFMSIVANSVYAMKKKAEKVTGAQTYVPEITIAIEADKQAGGSITTFRDNGAGIEEGIIEKIFDPFFTTKPTGEAPGVGLYLCQQIIQDYGGSISVCSEKDIFTEITIHLP
ncbi:MAG: ATP-binding protein [Bacteroidales bacterium]|nr:ATP-binding protein [Bacteroidales bacterium]